MIKKIINGRNVIIFLIIAVSFAAFTNITTSIFLKNNGINNVSYLDAKFNYSSQQAYKFLDSYTLKGRNIINNYTYTLDFIIPILFSFFLIILIKYLFLKNNIIKSYFNLLLIFPILAALFDWFENISIKIMLNNFTQEIINKIYQFTKIFTLVKFLFTILSLLLILIMLIILLINFIKKSSTSSN